MKKFKEYSIIVTLLGVDAFAYAGVDSGAPDFQNLAYMYDRKEMPIAFKNDELGDLDVEVLDKEVTNIITVEQAIKLDIIEREVAVKYFEGLIALERVLEDLMRSDEVADLKRKKVKVDLVEGQTPTQAPSTDNGIAKPRK